MNKTIVVFANSVKHHAHCVAGKDIVTKEWIRPVSDEHGEALTHEQSSYENNGKVWRVKPLDKISIEFDTHVPLLQQPENYLITGQLWETKYIINHQEISEYLDHPEDIWLDNSTRSDRVAVSCVQNSQISISQSLYLIRPESFILHVVEYENEQGEIKKRARGSFIYNGDSYEKLTITDPKIWREMNDLNFGDYPRNDIYLCVSLGEEFGNYFYKIIAAVI